MRAVVRDRSVHQLMSENRQRLRPAGHTVQTSERHVYTSCAHAAEVGVDTASI